MCNRALQGRNLLSNMQTVIEKSKQRKCKKRMDIVIIVFGMFCTNRKGKSFCNFIQDQIKNQVKLSFLRTEIFWISVVILKLSSFPIIQSKLTVTFLMDAVVY